MTRAQRKASAELREARRTAERVRRQRASYRKHHKPGFFQRLLGVVHTWHVAVRTSLLVVVVVLGSVIFSIGSSIEEEHYEADQAMVNATESQPVLWTGTGRKSFTAYVELEGQRVALDRSPPMFSPQRVGDTIMVVVDPKDKSHVVAANFDDTYWPVEPIDQIVALSMAAMVACAILLLIVGIAMLFLGPELRLLAIKVRTIKLPNRRKPDRN